MSISGRLIRNVRSFEWRLRLSSRPKRINSRPNLMKRLSFDICSTSSSALISRCLCRCLPKRMKRFEFACCPTSTSWPAQTVINSGICTADPAGFMERRWRGEDLGMGHPYPSGDPPQKKMIFFTWNDVFWCILSGENDATCRAWRIRC